MRDKNKIVVLFLLNMLMKKAHTATHCFQLLNKNLICNDGSIVATIVYVIFLYLNGSDK